MQRDVYESLGDFNIHCADVQDYIEGVDAIEERNIVDVLSKSYGEFSFLSVQIDCILNGRNYCNNDFTRVSSNGPVSG